MCHWDIMNINLLGDQTPWKKLPHKVEVKINDLYIIQWLGKHVGFVWQERALTKGGGVWISTFYLSAWSCFLLMSEHKHLYVFVCVCARRRMSEDNFKRRSLGTIDLTLWQGLSLTGNLRISQAARLVSCKNPAVFTLLDPQPCGYHVFFCLAWMPRPELRPSFLCLQGKHWKVEPLPQPQHGTSFQRFYVGVGR